MQIKALNQSDIPQLLSLCDAVGWLHDIAFMKEQFETFFSIGTLFGHHNEGKLISCIAVFPYKTGFTSIGMLIVHPNFQRRGLARSLLDICIKNAPPLQPFVLIATDAGTPLYHTYGFNTITSIHRLERNSTETKNNSFSTSQITSQDLNTLIQLDFIASGAHRSKLYSILLNRTHLALKIEKNNRLEAFALCIRKGNTLCVTPLIAHNEEYALHLLLSICNQWNGTVRIDVPHSQKSFRDKLLSFEFKETLLSPLMIKNGENLPGKRDFIFAMMDAALC
ncbi:GNAT family N-acetyltransferase [Bacillus sp. AFS018417]|uniref:GNAT family N-acetyltransferase n=1 Tax=Bacillus sp. AFS018417 TaxID=2033491 RepID=UPI000BF8816F|nr:GNAT family N-acetyltransferase [Bacillus sp. AFS018417]PEZ07840.1 GNAT family N-acetyltransferase [Bacillus sp. AFS018417]